jgi:hypothetical protein
MSRGVYSSDRVVLDALRETYEEDLEESRLIGELVGVERVSERLDIGIHATRRRLESVASEGLAESALTVRYGGSEVRGYRPSRSEEVDR